MKIDFSYLNIFELLRLINNFNNNNRNRGLKANEDQISLGLTKNRL